STAVLWSLPCHAISFCRRGDSGLRHAAASVRLTDTRQAAVSSEGADMPGVAQTETTRLLRDLLALPTVNPMGRSFQGPELFEHRVSAYLEELFRRLGVSCERQPVAPLRDNVVARTDFPGARRTILFEVHQDTVPTDHMTIDPFGAKIENGRLYGRGACDVKG